jgi:hypothetical protein
LGLDFNEEPMEGNDGDDQPTPIVKLSQALEYAQLQSNYAVEHPSEFSFFTCDEHAIAYG